MQAFDLTYICEMPMRLTHARFAMCRNAALGRRTASMRCATTSDPGAMAMGSASGFVSREMHCHSPGLSGRQAQPGRMKRNATTSASGLLSSRGKCRIVLTSLGERDCTFDFERTDVNSVGGHRPRANACLALASWRVLMLRLCPVASQSRTRFARIKKAGCLQASRERSPGGRGCVSCCLSLTIWPTRNGWR
jgi:hypothetical protein